MRWVLTHPKGVVSALKQGHPLAKCMQVIGETPDVDRATRLSIYGNGYFLRIIEVLGFNFECLKNMVGEELFDEMARAYLVKHPSTFRSIDDIGSTLSDFLKKHPFSKKFPYASDLAKIEWATHESFFADDETPLDPQKFKNVPESAWQNARFQLDKSVYLLRVDWPVDQIWRVDGELDKRERTRLKKGRLHILVFRRADKFVRVPRIEPAQYDLLSQLAEGRTLGAALLSLAKKPATKNLTLPIGEWFNGWISDGIFKRISFHD